MRLPEPLSRRTHQHAATMDRATGDVLVHGDHHDVDLFVRCLQMLGKMGSDLGGAARMEGPLPCFSSDKVTVLSLLSRSGFKVASLLQLLETQPNLYHVETIFMTTASSNDACEWEKSVEGSQQK